METVKDPAVLLGIGNTVALVGLGLYFHKRQNVLENELSELSEHLKTAVKKFASVQQELVSRKEMVATLSGLNAKIEETQRNVSKLGDGGDDVELLEEALESLSDLLDENGIEWDFPPKRRGRGRKKRSRKKKRNYSESSESSEESSDGEDSEIERAVAKQRKRKGKKKR